MLGSKKVRASRVICLTAFALLAGVPAAHAATINGSVFNDFNANGVDDAGSFTSAADPGVAGVTVSAYALNDNTTPAATATTAANGTYSLTGLATGQVRVEFTGLPAGFQPSRRVPGLTTGTFNGTRTQFVNLPNGGSVGTAALGIQVPEDFCADNPLLVTCRYDFGGAGTNDADPAVLALGYDQGGVRDAARQTLATKAQVGAVYGTGTDPRTGDIYVAAYMKRHIGFGPGGPGAIYRIPATGPTTFGAPVLFTTIPNAGANPHDPNDYVGDNFQTTFDAAGKISLGDLDVVQDGSAFYVTNLNDKRLYRVPLGGTTAPGGAVTSVAIPAPAAPACATAADYRPFGLGIRRGTIQVGGVCSEESSQNNNAASFRAVVQSYSVAGGTFSATPSLAFSLRPADFPRKCSENAGANASIAAFNANSRAACTENADETDRYPAEWRSWTPQGDPPATYDPPNNGFRNYPQPMLSDVEFDGNDLVLGMRDRNGDQMGNTTRGPVEANTNSFTNTSAGDILRACATSATTYAIESNAVCGGVTGAGAGNLEGPGGGEFYNGDDASNHDQTANGGIVQVPGFATSAATAYDPEPQDGFDGGVIWSNNATGARAADTRLYDGGGASGDSGFGKANGLGDLEAICRTAPIQIGNRVFLDSDADGVQDASEAPIAGVTVRLFDAAGNQVGAPVVTGADGEYYFDNLAPGTAYQVRIDRTQAALQAYSVSPATQGGNTERDSNGVLGGTTVVGAVTTGTAGQNDHSIDFGFFPAPLDLALRKTRVGTGTVVPGQAVTFQFDVFNQRTDAGAAVTNVVLTDYLPAGFRFDPAENTGWTLVNGQLRRTLAGPIAANAASPTTPTSATLVLRVTDTAAGGTLTNRGEILSFQDRNGNPGVDVDSTPDADPANDGTEVNDEIANGGGDQDDADLEAVTVATFDLALAKTTTATVVAPGQLVPFTLTVTNQSTSPVNDVVLSDALPAGYEFRTADNTNWTGGTAGPAVRTIAGPIAAGATSSVTLNLRVLPGATTATLLNRAQIIDFEDAADVTPVDVDSTPNSGYTPDEDDDAAVGTTLGRYDLALRKTTPAGRVANGALVPFTITVVNQGSAGATADDIVVTDTLPAGLTFAAADNVGTGFTAGPGAGQVTATITDALAAGQTAAPLTINLRVGANATEAQLVNNAEISAFTDAAGNVVPDADSTPDTINGNDGYVGTDDDDIDDPTVSQDDSDPAPVLLNRYDLALRKTTTSTQVVAGAPVQFNIDVFNQSIDPGAVATDIDLTDFIPAGYTFTATDNPGWTGPAGTTQGPLTVTQRIPSFGPAAGPITRVLNLRVAANATNATLTNNAEISAFKNNAGGVIAGTGSWIDTDSTPDAILGNDGYVGSDDDAVGTLGGAPTVSQDDSDPASVTLALYDLALTKTTTTTTAVSQGTIVPFTISVYNQGDPGTTAGTVVVRDQIPAGYDFDTARAANAGWVPVTGATTGVRTGPLTVQRTIASIAPSATPTPLTLELTVNGAATTGNLQNNAEVFSFLTTGGTPGTDRDSVPGNQQNGGPPSTDHDITGGGDTDDADGAAVSASRYDLALRKTTTATTVAAGEVVPFVISVFNQSLDASSVAQGIQVTDTIPAGFEYRAGDNPGVTWTAGPGANQVQTTIPGTLAPGLTPASVLINLRVLPGATDATLTNLAEISRFANTVGTFQGDTDSTPDTIATNDGPFVNDEVNGNAGTLPPDQDDADPASVTLVSYDLALRKTTARTTPVAAGEDVTFDLAVFNQATDARAIAQTVTITDRIPAGYLYLAASNPAWDQRGNLTGPAVVTRTITAPVAANNGTTSVPLVLRVAPGVRFPDTTTNALKNVAEISAFTNTAGGQPVDVDSTPDALAGDLEADNEINSNPTTGNPRDEDDADPATLVPVRYDLALNKTSAARVVARGNLVTYAINVVNQSPDAAASAAGIVVTDTIPAGLRYDPADNVGNGWTGGTAGPLTNTLTGTLAQGATRTLTLRLRVRDDATAPAAGTPTLTNNAEITAFTDPSGGPQTDLDSTPGSGVDPNPTDDELNPTAPGDQDDQDPQAVTLAAFDLALEKTGPTAPVVAGDNVTFTLSVTNESTDAAAVANDIRITDTVPAGFTFTAGDQIAGNGWVASASGNPRQFDALIAGPLAPGATATRQIVLRVNANATNLQLINFAEITRFENPGNTAEQDGDSTPDFPATDPDPEDDSDTAGVTLVPYDLALAKRTAVTAPVAPGDLVPFTITVTNQSLNARAIADSFTVTDTLPTGLTFSGADNTGANAGWNLAGNVVTRTIADDLLPGQSRDLTINLRVLGGTVAPATLTNTAEISAFTNAAGGQPVDLDSVPNTNPADDGYDPANPDDDDIDDPTVSQDDSDPASVTVARFDLALAKTTAATTVARGDRVPFLITVTNQSPDASATAYGVQVTDTLPAGLEFRAADNAPARGWTTGPGVNQITTTLPAPLAPGQSAQVIVDLRVRATATNADLTNNAEISDFLDATGSNLQPDLDSTPDTTLGNDGYTGIDDDSIATTPGGSEDDSDPASVTLAGFDLALRKTTTVDRVARGQVVPFTITVLNQATQAQAIANDIRITDTIPAGYVLSPTQPAGVTWAPSASGVANQVDTVIPGPLAPGAEASRVINLTVASSTATAAQLTNLAEISRFENPADAAETDVDSIPDLDATNDGTVKDDVTDESYVAAPATNDQDDHDIAVVNPARYDISLLKSTPTADDRVAVGDPVTYTFTLRNESNDPSAVIGRSTIVEDLPTGLRYAAADNPATAANGGVTWTGPAGGPLTLVVDQDIPAQGTVTRTITLRVATGATFATVLNTAQVGAIQDTAGFPPTDVDSTPGNGTAGGINEDDDDTAQVTLAGFDLALRKTTSFGRVAAGNVVPFTIQVLNQRLDQRSGVTNVVVVDYIPVGLEFVAADPRNAGWVYDPATRTARTTIPAIARNAEAAPPLTIALRVTATATNADLVNRAEIASFQNDLGQPQQDGDSTPDANPANDGNEVDDRVDLDSSTTPADEDDADPAPLQLARYDLALRKLRTSPDRVAAGDPVDFELRVFNQADPATDGQAVATGIQLTDTIPAGYAFVAADNSGWLPATDATGPATRTRTLAGPLGAGADDAVSIRLRVRPGATQAGLTNNAEITDFRDIAGGRQPDVDSTPGSGTDANPTNDLLTPTGPGDQDDQDPEGVTLARYDLALTKDVPTGGVAAGDLVPFTFTVLNQSPDARAIARNVQITDTIPAGMSFSAADNPGWTALGTGQAQFVIAGPITRGASEKATLNLRVRAGATPAGLRNFGGISRFEDEQGATPPDIDSTPSLEEAGEGPVKDGVVNEDHTANPAADSDDSDVATAGLARYDLALLKQSSDAIVAPGQAVNYAITVFNQASDPRAFVQNVTITDAVPDGFSFDPAENPGWSVTGPNRIARTLTGPIAPGASERFPLVLRVTAGAPDGAKVNRAEISRFEDTSGGTPADVDSTPDANLDDDPFVDDALENQGGDQDDHDAATVQVARFDLALRKTAPATRVKVFDAVDFTLTVFNQSTSPLGAASNIVVGDTIPAGFEFRAGDNPGWTQAGNRATFVVNGPLAPGASSALRLRLRVVRGATDQGLANLAEVASFTDVNGVPHADVDSTPDADPGNDNLVDDAVNNEGGDQDDHDIARVVLATPTGESGGSKPTTASAVTTTLTVKKTLLTRTLRAGRQATYRITVKNTGKKTAKAVVVCDRTTSEVVFLSASRKATFTKGVPCFKVGDLKAGRSTSVTVKLRVTGDARGSVVNRATADAPNTRVANARASKRVIPRAQRANGVTG